MTLKRVSSFFAVLIAIMMVSLTISPVLASADDQLVVSPEIQGDYGPSGVESSLVELSSTASQEIIDIDSNVVEATPYWVLLTAGNKEKISLFAFIDKSGATKQKMWEWKTVLNKLWKKYPVKIIKTQTSTQLTLDYKSKRLQITEKEQKVLGEIFSEVTQKMENGNDEKVGVRWFFQPTHEYIALKSCEHRLPSDLIQYASVAGTASGDPDVWGAQNPETWAENHGYIPIINFGKAPLNCETNITQAKDKYRYNQMTDAFKSFGHSSHYMADLGNPFHTTPYTAVDRTLHNVYEQYVVDYWNTIPQGQGWQHPLKYWVDSTQDSNYISSPSQSAKEHATVSFANSNVLVPLMWWNWFKHYNVITGEGEFHIEEEPLIRTITENRLITTTRYTNGLVDYMIRDGVITHTITAAAGQNGGINPSGSVQVKHGDSQTFTLTPESGYTIDEVTVDGLIVTPPSPSYTFSDVITDHTISATFEEIPTLAEWNWATDGWGDWQHTASWTGGTGSEYGPVIVNDGEGNHGEHGADVSLSAGSTQGSIWKTFTDPSGTGWNTITFKGLMSGSDRPGGRWMTIDINNNQVFGGTASQTPPGNHVPFEIKRSFAQSPSVTVMISNGQSPAWGPRFAMHYYSVELSRESTKDLTKTLDPLFVIPDGKGLVVNETSL
jgi:hypothetical protein